MTKNATILAYRFKVLFALTVFFLSTQTLAFWGNTEEKIKNFDCKITVHDDARVSVIENLTVKATGNSIKHGIVREIPLRYKDRFGNNFDVRFKLDNVALDNHSVPYKTKYKHNGVYIYIGDPEKLIGKGTYTYTIAYTAQRVLGLFDKHDELYWNITGNGWRLPIDNVHAQITLPSTIQTNTVSVDSYTGSSGNKTTNAQVEMHNNQVKLSHTKPLRKYQGVTIAVAFPKGHIKELSTQQKLIWFFQDNAAVLWLIIGLLLLITLYSFLYHKIQSRKPIYTIIPEFEPPKDFSPADVSFLNKKHFTNKAFASNIVWAAVRGYITIAHTTKVFKQLYTLKKTEKKEPQNKQIAELISGLFSSSESLEINKKNHAKINKTIGNVRSTVWKKIKPYIIYNVSYNALGFLLCILFIPALLLQASPLAFIIAGLYIPILIIGAIVFTTYTDEGHKLKQEVLGFKMYIETAEKNLIDMVGTPPTKTPELFEKYLPYAIALGIEKRWSHKFVPIFREYELAGKTYHPHWYTGRAFRVAALSNFSSSLAHSFSSAISSASQAPGTTSGSGGRGSSGGGSGGGGGGGW